MDAGCGNGRWGYGFVKLNCETHGFDPSEHGIEYAKKHVPRAFFNVANVLDYQGLQKLYKENNFDIVWCWGVLHHSGNPELGFKNLTKFVKPGGMIHLYIYGKKMNRTKNIRKFFQIFPLWIRKLLASFLAVFLSSSTHSNFDMFSPPIASNHTESEVEKWYTDAGFSFKRVYPEWALGTWAFYNHGVPSPAPVPTPTWHSWHCWNRSGWQTKCRHLRRAEPTYRANVPAIYPVHLSFERRPQYET